jgi:hypothetical protein
VSTAWHLDLGTHGREAVALTLAVVLHGGGIAAARWFEAPAMTPPMAPAVAQAVEVSLLVELPRPPHTTQPSRGTDELTVSSVSRRRAGLTHTALSSLSDPLGEWTLDAPPEGESPQGTAEAGDATAVIRPSQPHLSLGALGIEGEAYRLDLLNDHRRRPDEPDVGGLRRGLAERDAARGHGASGAAVSAAHGAALAGGPKSGTALFDVIVDGDGHVVSVTVVQARPDFEAWQRVASDLTARLKGRKLRVPASGNGIRTRLEVAVGRDATELAHRENPPPLLPSGDGFREDSVGSRRLPARTAHTESTREHVYGDPGVLSPSLGVGAPRKPAATAVGRSHRVRVTVVQETVL